MYQQTPYQTLYGYRSVYLGLYGELDLALGGGGIVPPPPIHQHLLNFGAVLIPALQNSFYVPLVV